MGTDPPNYPDAEDESADDPPPIRWGGRLIIAAIAVALVAIIVLHLSGTVGPAAH